MNKNRFRAWDTKHDRMRSVEYLNQWGYVLTVDGVFYNAVTDNIHETLIPLQSTGMVDKNGVEIFEGDIVEHPGSVKRSVVKWGGDNDLSTGVAGFYGLDQRPFERYRATMHTVVGNIYENEDLL